MATLPRRVWTEAEKAANRAATHAEWNADPDWSDWINDQANSPAVARSYDEWTKRA